jgi:phage shock protein C
MSRFDSPFARRVNPHRLYRSNNRWISGVTAGLAEYFGLSITGCRLVMAFCALIFFPIVPMLYAIMIFVLPRRPADLYRDAEEEAFWRTTTHNPTGSFSELRYRYRDMEERIRGMEAYVTSARFDFERELHRTPPKAP